MNDKFIVVIAGSRNAANAVQAVAGAFYKSPWGNRRKVKVISGGGGNIDKAAERFAGDMRFTFQEYPADWNKHGKAAGPIRNRQMAAVAHAGVVVWDGESRGTLNMLTELVKRGKPVYVKPVRVEPETEDADEPREDEPDSFRTLGLSQSDFL